MHIRIRDSQYAMDDYKTIYIMTKHPYTMVFDPFTRTGFV